jgi:hypothetical protein
VCNVEQILRTSLEQAPVPQVKQLLYRLHICTCRCQRVSAPSKHHTERAGTARKTAAKDRQLGVSSEPSRDAFCLAFLEKQNANSSQLGQHSCNRQ